jgi:hypothetical protein
MKKQGNMTLSKDYNNSLGYDLKEMKIYKLPKKEIKTKIN